MNLKDKNKINKMSAKDGFKMQLCWGLERLTTIDVILMFFFINSFSNFHPHLLRYSNLIPYDEEPNLSILSPKSLCKD